jgi:hypothetical protein
MLALWFGIVIAEPVTLHPCPMHDGVLATSMAGMSHAKSHHAHGAHASTPTDTPDHQPGGHHQCTCVGDCVSTAAVGLPGHAPTFVIATIAVPRRIIQVERSVALVSPDFVLPFANGPPTQA